MLCPCCALQLVTEAPEGGASGGSGGSSSGGSTKAIAVGVSVGVAVAASAVGLLLLVLARRRAAKQRELAYLAGGSVGGKAGGTDGWQVRVPVGFAPFWTPRRGRSPAAGRQIRCLASHGCIDPREGSAKGAALPVGMRLKP